jgi:3-methyladenine DNA glycosylase AlkD
VSGCAAHPPDDRWRAVVDTLDDALRAVGTPERAVQERRYLKSTLVHHGVTVPARRRVLVAWRGELSPLDRPALLGFVEEAWSRGVFELRFAAVEGLVDDARLLTPSDLAWLERLLREASTWALVDPLAAQVAGALLEAHPALAGPVRSWASDPDFWLRRSALLVHLLPMRRGDPQAFGAFAATAEGLLEEREFFIRKAIGWVLRERAKRCPDEVFDWLLPRAGRASGLTLREASRPLDEERRARLKGAARRTGG